MEVGGAADTAAAVVVDIHTEVAAVVAAGVEGLVAVAGTIAEFAVVLVMGSVVAAAAVVVAVAVAGEKGGSMPGLLP